MVPMGSHELVRAGLERGLQAELTEHMGYAKDDPLSNNTSNSRNGSTKKTVASSIGDLIPLVNGGNF